MMGAGLQGNIKRRTFDQLCVGRVDRSDAVDLGVGLAVLFVVAFPDDPVLIYEHGADHGIGSDMTRAKPGQLKTPGHVCFCNDQGRKNTIFRYGLDGGAKTDGRPPIRVV